MTLDCNHLQNAGPPPNPERLAAYCECLEYRTLYEYSHSALGEACQALHKWYFSKHREEDDRRQQGIIDAAKDLPR